MARSLNKIILVGNCGGEPETRNTPNSKLVQITVATSELRRDNQAQDQNSYREITEWHRVICWNKHAEYVLNNVNKGTKVYVEGHLRSNSYPDKNNPDIIHRNFEVVCDNITVIDSAKNDNYGYSAEPQVAQRPNGAWSAEANQANQYGFDGGSAGSNDYNTQGGYDASAGGYNSMQQMPSPSNYPDMAQSVSGQGNNQYGQSSQYDSNANQYGANQDFSNQQGYGGNQQSYGGNQQGYGNSQQGFGNNNSQNNNGGNGGYGGGSSNSDIPF